MINFQLYFGSDKLDASMPLYKRRNSYNPIKSKAPNVDNVRQPKIRGAQQREFTRRPEKEYNEKGRFLNPTSIVRRVEVIN